MPPRTTIRQVAEACGFSKSTVSLALRDHPSIRPATRREIQQTAKQLGYRANAALSLIAGNHWKARTDMETPIALVIAGNPSRNQIDGCHKEASRMGYRVDVFSTTSVRDLRTKLNMIYQRGIEGVLVRGPYHRFEKVIPQLERFAVVSLSSLRHICAFTEVTADYSSSVTICYRKARERGYRRIGAAIRAHEPIIQDDYDRYAAVLIEQSKHLRARGEAVIPPLMAEHHDLPAFKAWVRKHRPDCVIGFSVADLYRLRSMGYEIPGDLGFAILHVLHDQERSSGASPHQPEAAGMAVRQLDQLLRAGTFGQLPFPISIKFPADWYEGETLPVRHA